MLNEFTEVKAYLCNPDAEDVRLNPKLLSDNFKGECKLNGISDVLAMIACHYIYDFCKAEELNERIEKRAILILRIWCGFENDVSLDELELTKTESKEWFEKYPQAEGWLRIYHDNYLKEKGGDWTTYSKEWKSSLNSKNVYYAKRLSYENILAQAVARGPLKEYHLVVNKKYDDIMNKEIIDEKGKKPDARRQRTILKLLGAYRVLQLLHPGQKFVLMQTNRILNWLGFDSYKEDRLCLKFKWHEEPVFLLESHGDFLKFSVNQEFLSEIDVKLQEGTINIFPDVYNIYQDIGHGKKNTLKKL